MVVELFFILSSLIPAFLVPDCFEVEDCVLLAVVVDVSAILFAQEVKNATPTSSATVEMMDLFIVVGWVD